MDALRAPDGAALMDTQSSGPSVDFRTEAERAYHRDIEQGRPSAEAEGKQPKK
jgi:hypothetical protein